MAFYFLFANIFFAFGISILKMVYHAKRPFVLSD